MINFLRRLFKRKGRSVYKDLAAVSEERRNATRRTLDRSRETRERAAKILAIETESYRRKA